VGQFRGITAKKQTLAHNYLARFWHVYRLISLENRILSPSHFCHRQPIFFGLLGHHLVKLLCPFARNLVQRLSGGLLCIAVLELACNLFNLLIVLSQILLIGQRISLHLLPQQLHFLIREILLSPYILDFLRSFFWELSCR